MRNFIFTAIALSATIPNAMATLYIGYNRDTNSWGKYLTISITWGTLELIISLAVMLNENDACKRNGKKDFSTYANCPNNKPLSLDYKECQVTNPCSIPFTAQNGYEYVLAYCGTDDFAAYNGDGSFNNKCVPHSFDTGCNWEHIWAC
jgi:hypothetical protein